MKLKWNGRGKMEVQMPKEMKNKLCGICGDYNGDNTDDWRLGPDPCDSDRSKEGQLVTSSFLK